MKSAVGGKGKDKETKENEPEPITRTVRVGGLTDPDPEPPAEASTSSVASPARKGGLKSGLKSMGSKLSIKKNKSPVETVGDISDDEEPGSSSASKASADKKKSKFSVPFRSKDKSKDKHKDTEATPEKDKEDKKKSSIFSRGKSKSKGGEGEEDEDHEKKEKKSKFSVPFRRGSKKDKRSADGGDSDDSDSSDPTQPKGSMTSSGKDSKDKDSKSSGGSRFGFPKRGGSSKGKKGKFDEEDDDGSTKPSKSSKFKVPSVPSVFKRDKREKARPPTPPRGSSPSRSGRASPPSPPRRRATTVPDEDSGSEDDAPRARRSMTFDGAGGAPRRGVDPERVARVKERMEARGERDPDRGSDSSGDRRRRSDHRGRDEDESDRGRERERREREEDLRGEKEDAEDRRRERARRDREREEEEDRRREEDKAEDRRREREKREREREDAVRRRREQEKKDDEKYEREREERARERRDKERVRDELQEKDERARERRRDEAETPPRRRSGSSSDEADRRRRERDRPRSPARGSAKEFGLDAEVSGSRASPTPPRRRSDSRSPPRRRSDSRSPPRRRSDSRSPSPDRRRRERETSRERRAREDDERRAREDRRREDARRRREDDERAEKEAEERERRERRDRERYEHRRAFEEREREREEERRARDEARREREARELVDGGDDGAPHDDTPEVTRSGRKGIRGMFSRRDSNDGGTLSPTTGRRRFGGFFGRKGSGGGKGDGGGGGDVQSYENLAYAEDEDRGAGGSAPPVLEVKIHKTDRLLPHQLLTDPVVRVHVVDPATGLYLRKRVAAKKAVGTHEQVTENNTTAPRPGYLGYYPPVQTAPFSLRRRRQAVLAAQWEDSMVFDEDFTTFTGQGALLLFEVLQPPMSFEQLEEHPGEFVDGHFHVAWAFLKLHPEQPRVNLSTVRLQLYKFTAASGQGLRGASSCCGPGSAEAGKGGATLVFDQYRRRMAAAAQSHRIMYPASLHVSVRPLERPRPEVVVTAPASGIRPTMAMQVEKGRVDIDAMLTVLSPGSEGGKDVLGALAAAEEAAAGGARGGPGGAKLQRREPREPNSECLVPNTPAQQISAGARGAACVAFSHGGEYLAAVVADASMFTVRVYGARTCKELVSFTGHHDLVYDLSWAPDDLELITASSDFTAKVWVIGSGEVHRAAPARVFQHSCFVYCAGFHPTARNPRLVATGAYDGIVRVWDRDSGAALAQVDVHRARVNSLAFDALGKRLYTGDAGGVVKEFTCDTRSQGGGLKLLRSSNELEGAPVSSIRMHPSGRRLVVLCKRNQLVTFDLKLFAVNRRYGGVRCTEYPIQATVSPDGRYLMSGSEDGRVYLWAVESSAAYQLPHMHLRDEVVWSVTWCPNEHTVAICGLGPSIPIMLFTHDKHKPPVHIDRTKDAGGEGGAAASMAMSVLGRVHESHATERALLSSKNAPVAPPNLPDVLSPERIAEMLASLRAQTVAARSRVARGPAKEAIAKMAAGGAGSGPQDWLVVNKGARETGVRDFTYDRAAGGGRASGGGSALDRDLDARPSRERPTSYGLDAEAAAAAPSTSSSRAGRGEERGRSSGGRYGLDEDLRRGSSSDRPRDSRDRGSGGSGGYGLDEDLRRDPTTRSGSSGRLASTRRGADEHRAAGDPERPTREDGTGLHGTPAKSRVQGSSSGRLHESLRDRERGRDRDRDREGSGSFGLDAELGGGASAAPSSSRPPTVPPLSQGARRGFGGEGGRDSPRRLTPREREWDGPRPIRRDASGTALDSFRGGSYTEKDQVRERLDSKRAAAASRVEERLTPRG